MKTNNQEYQERSFKNVIKIVKNTFNKTKKLGLALALGLTITSCSPPPPPPSPSLPCVTTGTDFQQLYSNITTLPGHSNVVTYDSEVHSYTFRLAASKTVCSIGYQSQPAIAATPYLIEIYNNTTSNLVYTGSHVFSSVSTSYVTIPGVTLNAGDSYTIRRIQTNWGTNIANTIGRLVRNNSGNVAFPQVFGNMNITGSSFYQNAGTQTNWAIPYIDIVFQ
jgi:hypothetical protein